MRPAAMGIAGVPIGAPAASFTGGLGREPHCHERDRIRPCEAMIAAAAREVGAGPRPRADRSARRGGFTAAAAVNTRRAPAAGGRLGATDEAGTGFLDEAAWGAVAAEPPRKRVVVIEVDADAADADAAGGAPVFEPNGKPTRQVPTGACGHGVGTSLALNYPKDRTA